MAYVNPVNGNSLFQASDLAAGMIPDSNDRSGGGNVFTSFFGNDSRDATAVSEAQAARFSIDCAPVGSPIFQLFF